MWEGHREVNDYGWLMDDGACNYHSECMGRTI